MQEKTALLLLLPVGLNCRDNMPLGLLQQLGSSCIPNSTIKMLQLSELSTLWTHKYQAWLYPSHVLKSCLPVPVQREIPYGNTWCKAELLGTQRCPGWTAQLGNIKRQTTLLLGRYCLHCCVVNPTPACTRRDGDRCNLLRCEARPPNPGRRIVFPHPSTFSPLGTQYRTVCC